MHGRPLRGMDPLGHLRRRALSRPGIRFPVCGRGARRDHGAVPLGIHPYRRRRMPQNEVAILPPLPAAAGGTGGSARQPRFVGRHAAILFHGTRRDLPESQGTACDRMGRNPRRQFGFRCGGDVVARHRRRTNGRRPGTRRRDDSEPVPLFRLPAKPRTR